TDVLKRANATGSFVKELLKKEILEEYAKVTDRLYVGEIKGSPPNYALSPAQQGVKDDILRFFEKQQTVLLHGVTSSGKTLVYIDMIRDMLARGRQVLYLLPEIALTAQ